MDLNLNLLCLPDLELYEGIDVYPCDPQFGETVPSLPKLSSNLRKLKLK